MKKEKLKNYNQKVLAILGTLGIILVLTGIFTFGGIIISEYLRYQNYETQETGILSQEKVKELQKEKKREQVISLETPRLIDTLKSTYIIPVSHKTLDEKEDTSELLNAFTSVEKISKSNRRRYSKSYYGSYNNIIISSPKENKNNKIFNNRVNFNHIATEYFEDDILLLLKVAKKDTNKDGIINLEDFKSLFIYSFKNKDLREIQLDGYDVNSYKFIHESKDLIVSFGMDKNENGGFENYNEPTILKKYSFKGKVLTDLVEQKIVNELQKTLEGS